jgi:GT2 family glycosyltransferase
MPPEVVVIILNWNNASDTIACLQSVSGLSYPNYKVLVVDNGSFDGSVQEIRRTCPDVMLLELKENLGFAEGNNVGIRSAMQLGGDYVLILNNDVLVAPDAMTKLVEVAQKEPRAGLLGPRVLHREKPEQIQSAGVILDKFWRSKHRGQNQGQIGQSDTVEQVDAVAGCAMLVRRQLIDSVGMLDGRYFMYREDVDWCCRARANGFKVLYVPQAIVWHRDAQLREEAMERITYYMTRNTYLLLLTQKAGWRVMALVTLQNTMWLLNWTINPKWRHRRKQRSALLKAMVDAMLGNFGRQAHRYGL